MYPAVRSLWRSPIQLVSLRLRVLRMMTLPFRVDLTFHSAPASYMHVGTDAHLLPHQSAIYNARIVYDPLNVYLAISIIAPNRCSALAVA